MKVYSLFDLNFQLKTGMDGKSEGTCENIKKKDEKGEL